MVRYSVKLQLSSSDSTLPTKDIVALVSAISGVEAESVGLYVTKTHPQTISLSFKISSQESDVVLLKTLSSQLQFPLLQTLSLSVAQER
jgi:methenyltetrahydromethanopterin cyclohydrolase